VAYGLVISAESVVSDGTTLVRQLVNILMGQTIYQHVRAQRDPKRGRADIVFPLGTWIDRDFTDDTLSASFKFKTRAYAKDLEATVEDATSCDYTIWGESAGPIAGMTT